MRRPALRGNRKGASMTDQNYLTIGELARRVGVTVRTIQYYDQQGLLSPSAKSAEPAPVHRRQRERPVSHSDLEVPRAVAGPDQIRCSSLPRVGRVAGAGRRADGRHRRAVPVTVQAHDHPALPPRRVACRIVRELGAMADHHRALPGREPVLPGASPASATTPRLPRRSPRSRWRAASPCRSGTS